MNELFLSLLPVKIEYACLVLTRVMALIATLPIFSAAVPWKGYKIALGVGITWVLVCGGGAETYNGPQFGLAIVPLVTRELLTGLLMGWVVTATFGAVRGAGDLVTGEIGLNLATIVDPVSGSASQAVSTLYQTIAGLIFLSIGAHRWVFAGLARSFDRVPVGTFEIGPDPLRALIEVTSRLLESGLVLAAPMMAALFIVTLLLGLISRAVPQLNILDVGYGFRVAAGLGALVALLPALRVGVESMLFVMRDTMLNVLSSSIK